MVIVMIAMLALISRLRPFWGFGLCRRRRGGRVSGFRLSGRLGDARGLSLRPGRLGLSLGESLLLLMRRGLRCLGSGDLGLLTRCGCGARLSGLGLGDLSLPDHFGLSCLLLAHGICRRLKARRVCRPSLSGQGLLLTRLSLPGAVGLYLLLMGYRDHALLRSKLRLSGGVRLTLLRASDCHGSLLGRDLRLIRRIGLSLLLASLGDSIGLGASGFRGLKLTSLGQTRRLSLRRLLLIEGVGLRLSRSVDLSLLLSCLLTREASQDPAWAREWAIAGIGPVSLLSVVSVVGRPRAASRQIGAYGHRAERRGIGGAAIAFLNINRLLISILFVPGAPVGLTLLLSRPLPLVRELSLPASLPVSRNRRLMLLVFGGVIKLTRSIQILPRPFGAGGGFGVV